MYINDIHILFYLSIGVLGLIIGQLIDWSSMRLAKYEKVLSKDFFTQYLTSATPKYLLMSITAISYIALLYIYGFSLDTLKYIILIPMLINVFIIDYKKQIIPNRLTLTMFEIGLVIAFLYGLSDVAITINMVLGMLTGGGIFLLITLIGRSNIWKRSHGIW